MKSLPPPQPNDDAPRRVHVNPADVTELPVAPPGSHYVGHLWGLPMFETDTVPEGYVRLINGKLRSIDLPINEDSDDGN